MRYSVNIDDSGYLNYAKLHKEGYELNNICVDGKTVDLVITLDEELGFVERYKSISQKDLDIHGGELPRETLYGKVTFEKIRI